MNFNISNRLRPQTAYSMSQKDLMSGKFSQNDHQLINKLLDKNAAYFDHVQDQCICGLCICGGCKCGLERLKEQQGMAMKSQYQQDYVEKQPLRNKSISQLPTYKDDYTMKFETTQRLDFKDPKQRPQTSYKPEQPRFVQPFHAGSTYQLTHTKMPENEKVNIIPQNHPTVMKDLKFLGSSEYKRNFSGTPITKERNLIFGAHSSFGNPINPGLPFFGSTTSSRAFKPFKAKKTRPTKSTTQIQSVPTFDGQFSTITKLDFGDKSLQICPAKVILNSKKNSNRSGF
ncbi:unnamed protein product [Paramecium primaurelia]|uniref:STOP protein n=1 Tax=Paramecium primaurelia TaxID=5886 RepID=A0A8S1MS31_PARPR|nr:unnamed protein product [Paramecium primaurelia]